MKQDPDKTRKALLAKIHMAKKDLGMDEETYREMLKAFGLTSCKGADIPTLERVSAHLKRCGFKEKGRWGKKPRTLVENDPLLSKIEALLADGGYVWNYGHALAKRIAKVDRLEWCNWRQLHKIVAALEYNAKRKQSNKKGES
ncbi:MAG: hypothetical protein A2Y38_05525 [Spirochaetes bacterium GWB1_59_5]|nr:MAG: hypothetical protein A2Y38_05525 [Spirochaetes bacterium GWB1_59_5]